MKRKKIISILLCLILMLSIVACGSESQEEGTEETAGQVTLTAWSESESQEEGTEETAGQVTLTAWSELGEKASQVITSNNEIPVYDVLAEMTGVDVEWTNVSSADVDTQLNLLIASGQLPDLIYYNWQNRYSGGLSKAIEDGVAIPLNDLIEEHAPNLTALFEESPELKKQLSLDDGTIAMFPSARTDVRVRIWFGPQIRQDWLDNLDLEVPETMEDWYNVLTAFKEKDANGNGDPNDEIPFTAAGAGSLSSYVLSFAGAYGLVRDTFCVKDGTIVYSPADPAYKDFLAEMAKWYDEGLIDPDFAALDGNGVKSLVTTDVAGSYFGSLAGNLGGYNAALSEVVPEGKIIGAPWVMSADGVAYQQEPEHARALTGYGAVISTSCEDPVAAVKWLDEHYSEAGGLLMSFGIEGVSYDLVDGEPVFSDEIMNNPDGLTYDIALAKYALKSNTMEAMNDTYPGYAQYSLQTDVQKEANAAWAAGDTSILMPPISLTSEESDEYSKIMNEITTYVQESIVKFIMGQKPIDEFDSFVNDLNSMGLERATEIQQTAYDRFLAR